MLTAAYSTPASDWTRAIDGALADWSKYLVSGANLRINLHFDPNMTDLARMTAMPAYAGRMNGEDIYNLQAQATMQGVSGPYEDAYLSINPNWDWSFNGEPNKYDPQSVMTHELGHALFMLPANAGSSPFELWARDNPSRIDSTGIHTPESGLMNRYGYKGDIQRVTPDIAKMAGASGTPTIFDDNLFLMNGAKVDGGPGYDTANWLGSFDQYNAHLSNIERLLMKGENPLSSGQQDIYRLYRAGLNREPDLPGFQYWASSGKGLMQMANDFVSAPEFAPTANQPDRKSYISALYANILDRPPEQAGLDYWMGRTDLDKGGLLANIALAPENKADTYSFTL